MVNMKFPRQHSAAGFHARRLSSPMKMGLCSVNQSFSKPVEFSESSQRIRIECAQKPERGLQGCLLLVCHAAKQEQPRTAQGLRDRLMFFLLRMAFWLTVVLALLPTGSTQPQASASQIDATDTVVAAGAMVSDMTGFCERQPEACKVGAQAATVIGQRAQAGASMVYDFIHERMARSETGSVTEAKVIPATIARSMPSQPGSQSTLKATDLEPAWQVGAPRKENVPLPRPRVKQPA
jgi:Family of unknown function (DUF5330)